MVSTKTVVAAALLASTSNAFVAPNVGSVRSTTTSLNAIRRGGRGPRGPVRQTEYKPPMNDEIKHSEVRVNVATKDGKDEPLGILSKADALAKAKELGGLDLILINDNSDPPVCKIVDYSKYRYAQEKKRKEKAKNSKATEIKEVKMSYKIGDHDYTVRLKAATKFIKQGNRVKATVQFRGREIQHDKLGFELLDRLADDLEDMANMEGKPRREGRTIGAILSPTPEVVKAINDAKRQKEKDKKKAKAESLAKRDADIAAGAVAAEQEEEKIIGGVLDGIDLDDDDDDFDDDDDMDASLDELLGSSKATDDR
eukprot:CAMPEP_0113436442 /NCGR_PEP_ID=MMETSP0013_2-20120614/36855_1 /TAXON_ID=2843 ORGANISM="Skeletonema costatum, Strain 1716" /NCGR_SAMPLE_ID=MMETSP0013_2 /ASSEMBLY_ACC=CAM_ASM_000158 /LENGTH=311 /DNA_ID=CAMNT_0000326971 /DNA_START=89 /DNA_END=1020 /DNA_ORIENTATION=+ /assembly_acc=CAM_ASM_000158